MMSSNELEYRTRREKKPWWKSNTLHFFALVFAGGGVEIVLEFIRSGDFWSNTESGQWVFDDAGKDNVCRWAAPDANAFVPGHRISAVSLNADSTNFVDEQAAATGHTAIVPGGALGGIHDSHPDHAATSGGPGFVRFSDMETRLNESTTALAGRCTARANAACNSAQTYYCLLVIEAEAYQSVFLVLHDQVNNEYYNWDSEVFTASGDADDWGIQKRIRAEKGRRYYLVPFTGSAGSSTRSIRPEVRITGSGTADAFHAGCTDIPDTALFAVINGVHVGANDNPVCPIGTLPPASTVPSGTTAIVTDAEAPVLGSVVATGGGTDVRCRVNSDLTNWRVG